MYIYTCINPTRVNPINRKGERFNPPRLALLQPLPHEQVQPAPAPFSYICHINILVCILFYLYIYLKTYVLSYPIII